MRLVVDASVVVQVSLAGGRLGPLAGHKLLAPPILRSEVTSTLSEMVFRGEVPPDAGRLVVERLGTLALTVDRPDDLYERSWDVARSLGWAKTYDAEYVALAQIHDTPLLTIDERMRRGAGHLVRMPALTELGQR